jgi:hypothetical protein
MKNRIRVACLVGAGAAVAAFAACSGTKEPSAEPDAAATPAPPTDAGDSGVLRDAVADSEVRDASDAADGADGYDGAPLPGSVATVADIPGLTDFDLVAGHLIYRAPGFGHCTLPACADESALREYVVSEWSAGDDGRIHGIYVPSGPFAPRYVDRSVLFDGTGERSDDLQDLPWWDRVHFHGGAIGRATFRYQRFSGPGANIAYASVAHTGTNTSRVARAISHVHSNAGSEVTYTPEYGLYGPGGRVGGDVARLSGVSAPVPATPPTLVAVSAAGPTVPHPTVVVLRNGNVEACPLATPCLAWLNLGALGTILNLDDRHLYIGTPTGLSRCALAEIGTAGTCTLVPHGPVEAVEEPLYLTTTHAWYRSGTQVRRVLK